MSRPLPPGSQRRGGWPGPRKTQIVVPLDPSVVAAVGRIAADEGAKRAGVLRALVTLGLAVYGRRFVIVADSGGAALDQLSEDSGLPSEDVVRLALRYAVQHASSWLPRR